MTIEELGELVALLLCDKGIKIRNVVAEENCGTIWITHGSDVYALSLELCDDDND